MANETDQDRLGATTKGATVTDLNAYKANRDNATGLDASNFFSDVTGFNFLGIPALILALVVLYIMFSRR